METLTRNCLTIDGKEARIFRSNERTTMFVCGEDHNRAEWNRRLTDDEVDILIINPHCMFDQMRIV